MKNLVECFIWVEAQICVACESRLKGNRRGRRKVRKKHANCREQEEKGRERREEKADKSAREKREERTTPKRERSGRCCPFYNLLLGCPGTGPGNTPGRRMEYYVHDRPDPTRPDPTRPGQFSAALHNRTEPTFQKTGIVTTVGLKESGGKSDG